MVMTAERSRVVIVDDHGLFRHGLADVLRELGFDVVGMADCGEAGIRVASELQPDVVVMDIHMPGIGGVEAIRRLSAEEAGPPVLAMTVSTAIKDVAEAVDAGAVGYVIKDAPPDEIAASLRAAAQRATWLSPGILEQMRSVMAPAPEPTDGAALTERETDVLRLLVRGLDNATIAGELHVSPGTVKADVSAILTKLGVENRVQAAVAATDRRLV